jgi:uncharacterized protein YidB (DUF937 family)
MGLFDGLIGSVLSNLGNQTDNPMLRSVASMLANHEGGIDGLIQSFKDKGMGDTIASWIGSGENAPISADQLKDVLGEGRIAEIANSLGITHGDAAGQLATALPQLIDKLTPGGHLDSSLIEQAIAMFSKR